MLPQHSQNPFRLYKFCGEHVSVWCQKKYLHSTISRRPRTAFLNHFERKCLYILYISVRIFLFQGRSKILSGGGWVGGRLNNFLRAARCLGLVNCFTIVVLPFFILIEIFRNSTVFQYFDTSIFSIKTLKFSKQFGLQG